MNKIQRGIITAGLILMILLVVYPPWVLRVSDQTIESEYSFIWSAPTRSNLYYTIDRDRWIVPLLTVLIATIGFVKVFKSKGNNGGEQ